MGPQRNQSTAGWCCSFASADLIGYKLGIRVSAADLALEYTRKERNSLASAKSHTGCQDATDVLHLAAKKGVCPETDFPSQDLNPKGLVAYLKEIETQQAAFKEKFEALEPGWKNLWGMFHSKTAVDSALCNKNSILPPSATSGMEVLNVIRIQTENSMANIVYGLKDERCHRVGAGKIGNIHRLPPPFEFGNLPFGKNELDKMNEQLTNHNPVMIAYDVYMAHSNLPWWTSYDPNYLPGTHAALVIGRQWNKTSQKCDFLVRSSWGGKCPKGAVGCEEDGHFWVPEDRLLSSTMYATYLE